MLKVPFTGCQFYVADQVQARYVNQRTDLLKRLYRTRDWIPAKANIRPEMIATAIGFVNRFQTYLDTYMTARLIAPLLAVSGDSTVQNSVGYLLNDLMSKNQELREFLDTQDATMIGSVSNAWAQDKNILTSTAQQAAGILSKAETSGPQIINSEMSAMLNIANQAVRANSASISRLARAEILQANSSARATGNQASQLLLATNRTLQQAQSVFNSLNTTDKSLSTSQSNLNVLLAQLETAVLGSAQSQVVGVQNSSSSSQLQASGAVDTALQRVVQSVATALQRLTADQSTNLTSISASVDTDMNSFTSQIQSNLNDANRGAASIQNTYTRNISSTMSDINQFLSQVDQSLASSSNSLTAANSSIQALRGFMTTQFNDLQNRMVAVFSNQTQQSQLQLAALSAFMDSTLANFKVEAFNATRDGSTSLKAAYDSAIQTLLSGSDALSLTFDQRQKILLALANWQQTYQGNTNQLVNTFTNTYSGLIKDTNSALGSAVSSQAAQLSSMTAEQQESLANAIQAAQGDPNKLNTILSQFGIVGARAAAAADVVAQNMAVAGSSVQQGLGDGMTALTAIQSAASATSATYQQAQTLNQQASSTAQAAVKNVTTRLGVMNAVIQQYSTQLSQQLLGATSDANSQIASAASANSQTLSGDIQKKMASIQQMIGTVINKGQVNQNDLNQFAAEIGANATALTNLVNALQSDSSDAISGIVNAQKSSIDSLRSQVAAQLGSVTQDFGSQLSSEQASLSSLIEGLRGDLMSQAGSKSNLLAQQRDILQSLFGSMSSSSIQRQHVSTDMQQKLRDAESKSAYGLAELAGLIEAQKSRVMAAFNEKSATLKTAAASVNATIADTNSSAQATLADLQSKGDAKVQTIKKTLSDGANGVDALVDRYHQTVAKALEEDRQARINMLADEASRIQSVEDSLTQSAKDQANAKALRDAQAQARAKALAEMLASLSGAAQAASQGDKAFTDYVSALAAATNTNMGYLVQAMKANITSGNSALKNLLASNSIFATGVLNDLSQQAAALGQGAVDGGNGLLATLGLARSQSQAALGRQNGVFNGMTKSTSDMTSLTNDQLVQLVTIFLAQSALQDSSFAQNNQDTLNAIASLADAMDIALGTMDAVSNTTEDALNFASDETNEAQVEVNEATQAVIDYATDAATGISDQAKDTYTNIKNAIDQANSFTSAFRERLTNDQDTFNKATPELDSQLTQLKGSIADLGKTLDANKQAALDRVNQWAMAAEQDALNQISNMQIRQIQQAQGG